MLNTAVSDVRVSSMFLRICLSYVLFCISVAHLDPAREIMRTHFSFRLSDCTTSLPILFRSAGHVASNAGKLTGHMHAAVVIHFHTDGHFVTGIKNQTIYFMSREFVH